MISRSSNFPHTNIWQTKKKENEIPIHFNLLPIHKQNTRIVIFLASVCISNICVLRFSSTFYFAFICFTFLLARCVCLCVVCFYTSHCCYALSARQSLQSFNNLIYLRIYSLVNSIFF